MYNFTSYYISISYFSSDKKLKHFHMKDLISPAGIGFISLVVSFFPAANVRVQTFHRVNGLLQ